MKPFLCALILGSFLSGQAQAAAGLELTLCKPHSGLTVPGRWIGSLSYFRLVPSPWPGFSEWGMTAMPFLGHAETMSNQTGMLDSFVGAYTGHVFPLWGGLVRPGFQIGSVWQEEWRDDGKTGGTFALYYAFRIQASCLTFILSNQGRGLGVNFSL